MRLINADALKEYINKCSLCDTCDGQNNRCYLDCDLPDNLSPTMERIIDNQPTIEERKTGRWIVITKMDGRTLYECSVCGKRVIFDDLMDLPSYCDHCGAKMEGSEEDAK